MELVQPYPLGPPARATPSAAAHTLSRAHKQGTDPDMRAERFARASGRPCGRQIFLQVLAAVAAAATHAHLGPVHRRAVHDAGGSAGSRGAQACCSGWAGRAGRGVRAPWLQRTILAFSADTALRRHFEEVDLRAYRAQHTAGDGRCERESRIRSRRARRGRRVAAARGGGPSAEFDRACACALRVCAGPVKVISRFNKRAEIAFERGKVAQASLR